MDEQLGRLVQAFEQQVQGTGRHRDRRRSRRGARRPRRVPARESPLPGDDARPPGARRARASQPGVSDTPVSTRRVFHTILDWAGARKGRQPPWLGAGDRSGRGHETVSRVRVATAGDGVSGPAEGDLRRKAGGLRRRRRSPGSPRSRGRRGSSATGDGGPSRVSGAVTRKRRRPWTASATRSVRKLASLGYISATVAARGAQGRAAPGRHDPVSSTSSKRRPVSSSARSTPRPFRCWRRSWPRIPGTSTRPFVWRPRIPPSDTRSRPSRRSRRPAKIAPDSQDVRTYLALHYAPRQAVGEGRAPARADRRRGARSSAGARGARGGPGAAGTRLRGDRSAPADLRDAQAHADGARPAGPTGHERRPDGARHRAPSRGRARSRATRSGTTSSWAFSTSPPERLPEAKESLDRVAPSHPAYPMALFKRAQVSVLLHEPDQAARIAARAAAGRRDDSRAHRLRASVSYAHSRAGALMRARAAKARRASERARRQSGRAAGCAVGADGTRDVRTGSGRPPAGAAD